MTKYQNRYWVESSPKRQDAEKLRASDSHFNRNYGYWNTRFEVLPEVIYFCIQHLPYRKTQYEVILVLYQGGFDTHTGLPEHQNNLNNPIIWQKNEIFKSELPVFAVDVRTKKIKSTNVGYVKQYIDQSSSIRFGTLDRPAHFNSKADYTCNHLYEIMITSEINTLTQLCEIERTHFLTIFPSSQTNPYMAEYLLTGNRKSYLVLIEVASLWL